MRDERSAGYLDGSYREVLLLLQSGLPCVYFPSLGVPIYRIVHLLQHFLAEDCKKS